MFWLAPRVLTWSSGGQDLWGAGLCFESKSWTNVAFFVAANLTRLPPLKTTAVLWHLGSRDPRVVRSACSLQQRRACEMTWPSVASRLQLPLASGPPDWHRTAGWRPQRPRRQQNGVGLWNLKCGGDSRRSWGLVTAHRSAGAIGPCSASLPAVPKISGRRESDEKVAANSRCSAGPIRRWFLRLFPDPQWKGRERKILNFYFPPPGRNQIGNLSVASR